jgi:hypothetical protein
MGLALALEAWVLSVFGWSWLTVQNIWMPSLLSSLVFYGILLISSLNLVVSSLFVEGRYPRAAYFNTVLGFVLFCFVCIADTFDTLTFGGERFKPPDGRDGGCCANCDIARSNRALFFADSPLYVMQAGVLIGYLLVQLIVAAGQLLDTEMRSVWGGVTWGNTLALMLTARFIIMFDGSTLVLLPDSVIYVLLFSKPLMSLSIIYWLLLDAFILLTVLEGLPQLNIIGFRIVRGVSLGVTLFFVVLSCVVHGVRGMLTPPLFLGLCLVMLASVLGILEAFLGIDTNSAPSSLPPSRAPAVVEPRAAPRAVHSSYQHEHLPRDLRPRPFGMGGQVEPLLAPLVVGQRPRVSIPVSIQIGDNKKVL